MCDLSWAPWGPIRLATDNPAEDFRAYADTRFGQCRALTGSAEFFHRLRAIEKG